MNVNCALHDDSVAMEEEKKTREKHGDWVPFVQG